MLSLFVEINFYLKAELNYFPCQHCRNDRRRFRIMKLIFSRLCVAVEKRWTSYRSRAQAFSLSLEWNEIKVKPLFQLRLFNSKVP